MWLTGSLALAYSLIVVSAANRVSSLGFVSQYGSAILAVTSGSSADRAGLEPGDRITAVDGVPAAAPDQVAAALAAIAADTTVELSISRGGDTHVVRIELAATHPITSAVAAALAVILLSLATAANRTRSSHATRALFREAAVLVVFLAGAFSPDVVLRTSALAVIWYVSVGMIAPSILHFMTWFPAGSGLRSRNAALAIYGPGVVIASLLVAVEIHSAVAGPTRIHQLLWLGALGLAGIFAAICACVGAVYRTRRMRRGHIAAEARRWILVGSWSTAIPLVGGAIWALVDLNGFVTGGYRIVVAMSAINGTTCVVLALNHASLGALARPHGTYRAALASTAIAGGMLLLLCLVATSSSLGLTSTELSVASLAVLASALVFGPLRYQIERDLRRRLARDQMRRYELLRSAANAALDAPDFEQLCQRLAVDTRTACCANAVLLLQWRGGQWATRGSCGPQASIERMKAAAISADRTPEAPVEKITIHWPATVFVPIPSDEVAALLAIELADHDCPTPEQLELLKTLAAHVAVAMANARAHGSIVELHEHLEVARRRTLESKQEISRLKEQITHEDRQLLARVSATTKRQPVIGSGLVATFALARRVAQGEATVLISGETGVGKEIFARTIHEGGRRADGPFVVVDCGSLALGLAEPALFGHVIGAFTGATCDRPGAFRSAEGGTLFLDEIGELPLALQPALLRVLQERDVQPVGASVRIPVDVRIVAGTHRDLAAEVQAGTFRRDLLYRLKVFELHVPPLRDRRDDIPALVASFQEELAAHSGKCSPRMSDEAMSVLLEYDWPGNVRELRHAVEAAVILATDVIEPCHLPIKDNLFAQRARGQVRLARGTGLQASLSEVEKERIEEALREHHGNRTRAARALGMSRGAFLRRLKRYEIDA